MARIPEARNWTSRLFDALARRIAGKPLAPFRIAAHRPSLLLARGAMEGALRGGCLDPKLKTLASLRTALQIGCPH